MDPECPAERSRARVDSARETLEATFGEVPVVDQDWPVSPATYDDYCERLARGTLGGAGARVGDDRGRVALVREGGREGWSEPSGHHEPGESLQATARREVREETGLEVDLDGVGLFQHLQVREREGARQPLHRVAVVFLATRVGGTLEAREGGIEAAARFSEHPDDLLYDALRRLEIPAADGDGGSAPGQPESEGDEDGVP